MKEITKTRFTTGFTCVRATIYALTRKSKKASQEMKYISDNGQRVHELARKYFDGSVMVTGRTNAARQNNTIRYINAGKEYICEAAFMSDNLFAAVDILHVLPNKHVEVYEVKSATKVEDNFYLDLAFQVYVLEHCGYTVDAAYIMIINSEFIKHGDIDPKKFFIIEDAFDEVKELQEDVDDSVGGIRSVLSGEKKLDETPVFGKYCFKPNECPYWDECKKGIPEDSVFEIKKMSIDKKIGYYYDGVRTMKDLLGIKDLTARFEQQARLQVEKSNKTEVKMNLLMLFLSKLVFPITSLDFETIFDALPLFDGTKPYSHQVTQYSVHVLEEKGGILHHFDYLAEPKGDWRIPLAHELVKVVPEEGSIIVWNDEMESNRLMELADLPGNEDIRNKLLSIKHRIVDLMDIFLKRIVYNRFMEGSYSVKHVLPAFYPDREDLRYDGMPINNGMLATITFSKLLRGEITGDEAATARKNLLTYCELDTYGPFAILDALFHLSNPKSAPLYKRTTG